MSPTITGMQTSDSAPVTRGYKKKERTRRRLLDAAISEIAAVGEAFTILDVTRRADVSNGTFYNYFDDRDALISAVIDDVLTTFTDTSAELVAIEDPVRRFATITALFLEHSTTNPQLATVLLRLTSVNPITTDSSDPLRHLRNDLTEAFLQGRITREPSDAAVDLAAGTLFRAVLRLTTAGADDTYRAEVIGLLLETFGLERSEALAVAADAVEAAPEIERALANDSSPPRAGDKESIPTR